MLTIADPAPAARSTPSPTGLELHFDAPTLARLHTTTASGRTVALPRILRTPSPRAFWVGPEETTTFRFTIDAGGRICPLGEGDVGRYADTEPG